MEKSLTDNEIIKALKCCSKDGMINCRNCPYEEPCNVGRSDMQKDALDLINRLKAENERLESLCEKIGIANDAKFELICVLQEDLETAKTEARKEFAEIILNHLHQRIDECDNMTSEDPIWVNRLKWAMESIVIFIHECLYKQEKEMEKET